MSHIQTYEEHVFRYERRTVECEKEPLAVFLCHLPPSQDPESLNAPGVQKLDRGHDWNWRHGELRLSVAGTLPKDMVRILVQVREVELQVHCGFTHPEHARFCCMCGEAL